MPAVPRTSGNLFKDVLEHKCVGVWAKLQNGCEGVSLFKGIF